MAPNPDAPFYEIDDDQAYGCPDHTMEWQAVPHPDGGTTLQLRCRTCLSTI